MQKIYFKWFVLAITIVFIDCATSNRTNNELAIGMVTYNGFENITPPSPSDTSYKVINGDADFDRLFRPVNGKPERPDFNGQTAVAVQAPAGSLIIIDRIAIQGHFLNVYAVTCIADQVHCATNGLAIATAPRSENVKHVRFFFNGVQKKVVERGPLF